MLVKKIRKNFGYIVVLLGTPSNYYVVYSIQMDQVIWTCTYVELKSLQMDKVICIIAYLVYANGSSHLHFYKLCYIFYEDRSNHLHLYLCWVKIFSDDQQIIWIKEETKKVYLNKNANCRAKFFLEVNNTILYTSRNDGFKRRTRIMIWFDDHQPQ